MIGRLLTFLRTLLISFSQLAQVLLVGLAYVPGLAPKPRARDTLSAFVGRRAMAGQRWALLAERIIDWIFERFGEPPGHCRREALEAA